MYLYVCLTWHLLCWDMFLPYRFVWRYFYNCVFNFHVAFLHLLEWLNNTYSLFYMIYHIYWFASIDYCVLYKSLDCGVWSFCWIWFAYILLRTFASMCIKNSDLCFLCVYMYFLALVFGNTGFVKRFGRTFLYSIFLKDYEKGK